tara:strand:+ start:860 stop:1117 length:258 start_codon:yes stop_codon:yes gene_type:complete
VSYPKVIRANPKRLKYQVLRNGVRHLATPPTYILFGVDDEGKGIYRCSQGAGIILIDEHRYSFIPVSKFKTISLHHLYQYHEVIV